MANPILSLIGQLLASAIEKKAVATPTQVEKAVEKVAENKTPEAPQVAQAPLAIDWSNPKSRISKYFTVEEAILLREWKRLGNESDGLNDTVKKNLIEIFKTMDLIREHLGVPVYIKSAWRPSAYNVHIGGAKQSAHMADKDYGAVDFWCDKDGDGDKDGDDCDLIKEALRPKLVEWNIRMEDNGKGARWVHVDNRPVPPGGNREFKP